jgi:hypothetical protein
MIYTINARKHDAIGKEFRLQKDNSWKQLTSKALEDTDFTETDPIKVWNYSKLEGLINIQGQGIVVNQKLVSSFGSSGIAFTYPVLHRTKNPGVTFTKDDIRNIIRDGNDDLFNCLVIGTNGKLRLDDVDLDDIMHNPEIAVRNEVFCAGNEYVGIDAAKDKRHIGETYSGMLNGWYEHLQTGRLNVFVDYCSAKPDADIIKAINSLVI